MSAPSFSRSIKSAPGDPVLRARDERLESLKVLVGQLAHDFNNFLVPTLGYVTLIKEDISPEAPAYQYAMKLENSARRTEGMLETILLAVRPQRRFSPQMIDFTGLVEAAVKTWQTDVPALSQITVGTEMEPGSFWGDGRQWSNAVLQLLNNARFALATGGEMNLRLRRRVLDEESALRLNVSQPDILEFVVQDNGFGMSEEILKRAFDPFFTTRQKGQSAGLGLTIVHSVTQFHGGQVEIQSTEDVGTTVTLWIPVTQKPATPARDGLPAPVAERAAPSRGSTKVLLVEDDPLVREVIKAYLQRLPLEVFVAQDGSEGWKLFQKHGPELALIVSDVTMPKMNGIEFYQNVRRVDPNVRVVFMSGDAEATNEEALARLGAHRPLLIKKPFTLKAFTETIRSYLPADCSPEPDKSI